MQPVACGLKPINMKVQIVTPDTNLFEGEAESVKLPGIDGLFEVKENHAPMIAALKQGSVTIDGGQTFEITGGFSEVLNNQLVVLVEGAAS